MLIPAMGMQSMSGGRQNLSLIHILSDRYTSNVFGSAKGDEAFTYTISDEIFDELDYKSVKYAEDLRAGDVIYDSWNELWGVVVDVDTKNEVCTYGSIDSKDRIAWDFEADFDDLDEMYTRYPSSSSSSSDDELTNGEMCIRDSLHSNQIPRGQTRLKTR